jgi:hypothetical protein
VPWEEVRSRLDQNGPFANMFDTPLYRDAGGSFSREEYARRWRRCGRDARAQTDVDRARRPNHWARQSTWLPGIGNGMISSYVVVPLEARRR